MRKMQEHRKCVKLNDLSVVIWKNLLIRKRHWFLTIIEVCLPIILFLVIAFIRSKVPDLSKVELPETIYPSKTLQYKIDVGNTVVYYAPNDSFHGNIMKRVQEKLQLPNHNIKGFDTAENLINHYRNDSTVAIIFKLGEPTKLSYTIRCHEKDFDEWKTNELYSPAYAPNSADEYQSKNVHDTLLTMQMAVDISYIEIRSGKSSLNATIALELFPSPPQTKDVGIRKFLLTYLPLLTIFSFIFICPAVLKRIVEEKESGIKELLNMAGMKPWMTWLGWYIHGILPIIISIVIIIITLKVPLLGVEYPAIEFTHFSILGIFLFLYCSACICFCFLISTFFHRPSYAMVLGIFVWILSYELPVSIVSTNSLTFQCSMLFIIFPNVALYFGYYIISVFENRELGVHWTNLFSAPTGGQMELSLGLVFVAFIIQSILFVFLTMCYFDLINSGPYGKSKSILFPLYGLRRLLRNDLKKVSGTGSEPIESDEETGHKAIVIDDLCKRYDHNTVLDKVRMEIVKNEITVLLGHNGAGKSTTMSILTGMTSPTSGSIKYEGRNIFKNMDSFRRKLGLCPQHNLLFPDLTVKEHLIFFGRLKGLSYSAAEREANHYMQMLNISNKADTLPMTVSGGMKRKLCLAMALIGNSPILVLDEPTSGLDQESRRELWDLLLEMKNDRTIIITTHFMEEADALADRIVILSRGSVICKGTPLDLKKKYETGYHLFVTLKDVEKTEEGYKKLSEKTDQVTELIKNKIPGSELKSQSGNNLVYVLSIEEKDKLIELLKKLEDYKEDYFIQHLSLKLTTLEDVFLKATHNSLDSEGPLKRDPSQRSVEEIIDKTSLCSAKGGCFDNMFKAFWIKRWYYFRSNYIGYVVGALFCIIMFFLSCWIARLQNTFNTETYSKMEITLSKYGDTTVFYNASKDAIQLGNIYENIVNNLKSHPLPTPDVIRAIINKGKENIAFYKQHMITAAEFKGGNYGFDITILHSPNAYHSTVIGLNLITNALVKYYFGNAYSIETFQHPLSNDQEEITPSKFDETAVMMTWLILFPMGMLFFLGCFILFPHSELSTNFYDIQLMFGSSKHYFTSILYWTVNLICDLLISIIPLSIILICSCWFVSPHYYFLPFFCILFFYMLSMLPFTYLYSRKKSVAAAFSLLIIMNMIVGFVFAVTSIILLASGQEDLVTIGTNIKNVLLVFSPHFGLIYNGAINAEKVVRAHNWNLLTPYKQLQECLSGRQVANPCCSSSSSLECQRYQHPSDLTTDIWMMLIPFVIYFLLNIFIDCFSNIVINKILKLKQRIMNRNKSIELMRNFDIADGVDAVDGADNFNDKDELIVKDIEKYYGNFKAVDKVSFHTLKRKCIGLLGVNGAGKTTTFKALTNEILPEFGDIYYKDMSKTNVKNYLNKIGYCPQFDYLNFKLTPYELLKSIAILRGIPAENVDDIVMEFLDLFSLKQFKDRETGKLSGGNKRKLCMAISIISFPSILLMDEPTNGVDPASRRQFWTIFRELKDNKKIHMSFVLTSHSMKECEMLCDELIIMKQGQIKKQGNLGKLQQEIGGYKVEIKLRPHCDFDQLEALKETLKDEYELKNENSNVLYYELKHNTNKRLYAIFEEFLNYEKNDFKDVIEDYVISEASLEDVFMAVAKDNNDTSSGHNTLTR